VTDFNAAFRKWVRDSQVVDTNGDPLVVYHGTRDDAPGGKRFAGQFYDESHFSESREVAERMAGPEGRIIPVYLSIQNPKYVEDLGNASSWSDAMYEAMEDDHDGFAYENEYEGGGMSFMTFWNTQIKSAEENDGTWDADDPDIRSNPSGNLRFYHGTSTALDLRPGDLLLPPKLTGKLQEVGRKLRMELVFFTLDRESARIYAGRARRIFGGEPVVFEVDPHGEIEEINLQPGTTVLASPAAEILREVP